MTGEKRTGSILLVIHGVPKGQKNKWPYNISVRKQTKKKQKENATRSRVAHPRHFMALITQKCLQNERTRSPHLLFLALLLYGVF
jgi:hypothetical protein